MSDLTVSSVVAAAGKVEGRVKLQKMIFLLQEMGYDLGYGDYVFLLHGPYSEDLASDLDRAAGVLLKESQEGTGMFYSHTGEEVLRYVYRPQTKEWRIRLLSRLRKRFGESGDELVDRIAALNRVPAPVLELVASAVFIRERDGVADLDATWDRVRALKPHLSRYMARAKRQLAEWDEQQSFVH